MTGILALVGALAFLWVLGAVWLARWGERQSAEGSYDAIIVPGCRVMPDGQPSGALARRVVRAVEAFERGHAPLFVTTGGLGRSGPTEASAAAELALRLGVPSAAIVQEDRSTTTEENARFAAGCVRAERVLVVTDAYHAWRSRRVFARHFREVDALGVRAPGRLGWKLALREVGVCVAYGARGRLF